MKPCLHASIEPSCRTCFWSQDDSDQGRRYRAAWGLPEPDVALIEQVHGRTVITADRLAVLTRTVKETCGLPGVLGEFGVWRGGSAKVMAMSCPGKKLHLWDTWTGIPEDDTVGTHRQGDFAANLQKVQDYLARHDVVFHPGIFPATAVEDLTFACCHIDMDTYQSTRAAIDYVWPRLVPGGILVFDDWKYEPCKGVEKAIRELLPDQAIDESAAQQCRIRKPAPAPVVAVPARAPVSGKRSLPGEKPEKIILRQHQCPGDWLCCEAALASLHLEYPGKYVTDLHTGYRDLWLHHPHVTPLQESEARVIDMQCPDINMSHVQIHFLQTWCSYLGKQLGISLPLRVSKPGLYLSPEEKSLPRLENHWLINSGYKDDCHAKWWGWSRYQQVVEMMPDITFIQVGESWHHHRSLEGSNVVNMVGKTDANCRPLIKLASQVDGGVGGVSFIAHVMAALEKPYVCINLREPPWFTAYPRQTTLGPMGKLPCCQTRGCWSSRILPEQNEGRGNLCSLPMTNEHGEATGTCASLIEPADVVRAIRSYYYIPVATVVSNPAPVAESRQVQKRPASEARVARQPCKNCGGNLLSAEPVQSRSARRPGMLRKAANLAGAVWQHARAGLPVLTPEQASARLEICQACPEFDTSKKSCRMCGCNMGIKASWKEQKCPLEKWPQNED